MRVAALLAFKGTPYFDFLMMDERIYHDWAKDIVAGTYTPQTAYEFPPLPAYLTALIYKLFSPDPVYWRYCNIVLGTMTCLLIGLAARQPATAAVGLLAAFMAAVYEPFILYSVVPLKTALSVFLCAAIVCLTAALPSRPTLVKSALLGMLAGLALNVRGNYLAFVPLLAAAIVYAYWKSHRSWKRTCTAGALYAAALILVVAPFTMRNHEVSGEWVLSTTQAGFNFYLGNNLNNPEPYSRPAAFAASSPILQGVQFTIEASRRSGQTLTAKEASWFWTKEVIRQATERPAAFVQKLAAKALASLNRFEACDHYSADFLSTFMPFFRLPFPGFMLVMPLGLAGMLLEFTQWKRGGWLGVLFLAYFLSLLLFFTNGRYRLPLVTILIPFASLGIHRLATAVGERNLKPVPVFFVAFSCFLILGLLPVPGSRDQTAYYNMHGVILHNNGDHSQALQFWEASARMQGSFSPYADLMLAQDCYRRGAYARAKEYLDNIPDHSFAATYKYALLADVYRSEHNFPRAVAACEKSLGINSGQLSVRQKLVELLQRLDPAEAERQAALLTSIAAFHKGL